MSRPALRAGWWQPDLEFVHVNEIAGGAATAAHLLTFDSIQGRWDRPIDVAADALSIDGRRITFSSIAEPGAAPWRAQNVDLVLECSGKLRTVERLDACFDAGVRKVIVRRKWGASL